MNYTNLKLEELQKKCSSNGLSTKGIRVVLIERLKDDDEKKSQFNFNSPPEEGSTIANAKPKTDTLYIQLKASNLPYYFNSGVVYPLALEESKIYKDENRKKDLFTQFPEYIILSEFIINSFDDDDILIEVITNKLNIKSIDKTDVYCTGEPIPISRIKKIHFNTIGAKNTSISSAKSFFDSFIQEQLCVVSSTKNFSIKTTDLSSVELPHNPDLGKWGKVLKKFDKIMGMFSFMKNAGVFFSEIDSSFQEYTQNYFCALSLINSNIKSQSNKDLGFYKYILFPLEIEVSNIQRVLFCQIMDSIDNDLNFDLQRAQKIIQEAITPELATAEAKELNLILNYFEKLEQHQIAYTDLLLVDEIRNNYPILALLFLSKFPNKSRPHTDKQGVRSNFILHEAQLSKSVTEYLLGILGLYYGYKTMIKQDTNINLSDATFATMSEQCQSIKFKLTSTLDRFTIESIFHFCKSNKTISDEYSFLNIQPAKKQASFQPPNSESFTYTDNSYTICSTKITVIDRKNKWDEIVNSIYCSYPNRISGESQLTHYLISKFGHSKEAILELVKANTSKINIEELEKLIALDQILKNNK